MLAVAEIHGASLQATPSGRIAQTAPGGPQTGESEDVWLRRVDIDRVALRLVLRRLPLFVRSEVSAHARRTERLRAEFATGYYPLVVRLAIWPSRRQNHLTLDDLVQEGNIGLLKSVDRYDWRKHRFTTFAHSWIRAHIGRAILAMENEIRAPAPSVQEYRRRKDAGLPYDVVRLLGPARAYSFDDPQTDGDESRGVNLRSEWPTADDLLATTSTYRRLWAAVDQLPERDRYILRQMFSEQPPTLEGIGDVVGISRERVRQIAEAALVRLRKRLGDLK